MCLYGICDNLYKPQTSIEIIFCLIYEVKNKVICDNGGKLYEVLPPFQNDGPTPRSFMSQKICQTNILELKTPGGRTITLGQREYVFVSRPLTKA